MQVFQLFWWSMLVSDSGPLKLALRSDPIFLQLHAGWILNSVFARLQSFFLTIFFTYFYENSRNFTTSKNPQKNIHKYTKILKFYEKSRKRNISKNIKKISKNLSKNLQKISQKNVTKNITKKYAKFVQKNILKKYVKKNAKITKNHEISRFLPKISK